MKITIAHLDPNHIFRDTLTHILGHFDYKIIISESCGDKGLSSIKKHAEELDICILEIGLNNINGYDILTTIKKEHPYIKVLVISNCDDRSSIMEMLHLGAVGFISKKKSKLEEVKTALNNIYYSGFYFSKIADRQAFRQAKLYNSIIKTITKREQVFLNYCIMNKSYDEISTEMSVSKYTIETYRDSLFRKFEVHSKSELIIKILKLGYCFIN